MNDALKENDNCAETYVTLRIMGDAIDPSVITAGMIMQPTYACRKGDVDIHNRNTRARTGIWTLESMPVIKSRSLEKHLQFILDNIEARRNFIKELSDTDGVCAEILCFWMSESGHGGPIITADTLNRIGKLGLDIDFDFYCLE